MLSLPQQENTMMKNKIMTYPKEEAFAAAKDFFISASHFDMEKPRHQKMMDKALSVYENEKPECELKVLCTGFGPEVYCDNKIEIDGVTISCNGFSRIDAAHVKAVYICVITAGEWIPKADTSTKSQVYMDMWGTAFVDSAKTLFEKDLQAMLGAGEYLSDPFGPGYYGMPHSDIKKFAEIIPMDQVGVELRESGIMIPLKTMAAIYLVTDDPQVLPPTACSECFGRLEGCHMCRNFT